MIDLPFNQARPLLSGRCAHSDGALSPEETGCLYGEAGYEFLAITDHFHRRDRKSSPQLCMLPYTSLRYLGGRRP